MTDAVAVQALAKSYGAKRAVDGLSFAAPQGAITGVLGPNGAGKSTTLRILCGILRADGGSVEVLGSAPMGRVQNRVGYLPEERGMYRNMSPRSFIAYMSRLKGVRGDHAFKRADGLLQAQGLSAYARKPIKALSKGMAQKVQLAAAIAHEPDLIILDEPFSGLDPVNQKTVEELIRDLASQGRTVLFSTHIMEHAERLCDRVVMIAQGRKAFEGAVSEALALVARVAQIETEGAFDFGAALAKHGFTAERVEAAPGGVRWRVPLPAGTDSKRLLSACVSESAPLTLFEPARASLHDAFVRLVAGAGGA
jgi:ABC-2 type transport system ATP-binding protein